MGLAPFLVWITGVDNILAMPTKKRGISRGAAWITWGRKRQPALIRLLTLYRKRYIILPCTTLPGATGKEPFAVWFRALRDIKAKAMVLKRIERLEGGNFGTCKPCRDGVFELKIDFGPGYRVYDSIMGTELVLLPCAGDKNSQQSDIERAMEYLQDFKERAK